MCKHGYKNPFGIQRLRYLVPVLLADGFGEAAAASAAGLAVARDKGDGRFGCGHVQRLVHAIVRNEGLDRLHETGLRVLAVIEAETLQEPGPGHDARKGEIAGAAKCRVVDPRPVHGGLALFSGKKAVGKGEVGQGVT
jgi:hypothetical protein